MRSESYKRFQVRTDLALEAREDNLGDAEEVPGILFEESSEAEGRVKLSSVTVKNRKGAKQLGKPEGIYITLESEALWKNDGGINRDISHVIARQVRRMLQESSVPEEGRILVAGLGNPGMTSDSLGPKVVGNLKITRNLYPKGKISGIVPGVMAQTGMEAVEIVRGIAAETKPEAVIVIDALAARSVKRLGTTIQLTNTGIQPGSGVGNHRNSLDRKSVGVPVLAIGVPTVVGAAAIVCDVIDQLMGPMEENERRKIAEDLVIPRMGPMYVTPKDIDDRIRRLSYTISEGLNIAFLGDAYNEE